MSSSCLATWRLMWRMLWRDLRAGELNVLGLALLIAVAALGSVNFLGNRLSQGLIQESHQLLGADLVLSADQAIPLAVLQQAQQQGLLQASTLNFPSMVRAGEHMQLADIKAVSTHYPLRGKLHIRLAPGSQQTEAHAQQRIPAPGTVWLDERLAGVLQLQPGDQVQLGAAEFTFAALLIQEPDRGMSLFSFAPRLLLNQADLAATGLIQPASRVNYRQLFAGTAKDIQMYRQWLQAHLERGQRLEDMTQARPEMRQLLERAERFLRLAALLAVILASIAIALATERYLRRHLDGCALLRCLGMQQAQLLWIHAGGFVMFGLLATTLGLMLGYGVQSILVSLLGELLQTPLPAPTFIPWLQGLSTGLLLVLGFVLPPLLRLRNVPALRVLHRDWPQDEALTGQPGSRLLPQLSRHFSQITGFCALAVLMYWIAGDARLAGYSLLGFASLLVLSLLAARFMLKLGLQAARRWLPLGRHAGWRLGLGNLQRHPYASLLQITALSLGLTALLLLFIARQDLLASWQAQLPEQAPNRFIINIQPEQDQALGEFFRQHGLPAPELQPMIRARLTAINGQAIDADRYQDERARHLANREFNLSWTSQLPPGNQIIAGRWHGLAKSSTGATPLTEFSVEQGLAKTLGLQLQDELSYEVAGETITGRITSLRKLSWDSMRVNFFVITPPGVLENHPRSDITSFYLPDQSATQADFSRQLLAEFPNLTLIDVSALLKQLQDSLEQISRAIELIFSFALLAGLAVLLAALQSSQDQRQQELALLRVLGASNAQLSRAIQSEFFLLGSLAGLLAGLGASLISALMARFVLQLDYLPTPWLIITGVLLGALLSLLTGLLASRGLQNKSALSLLRSE